MQCSVCGGQKFSRRKILWRELIDAWQLSTDEAEYIDRQQGEHCAACGANLRSIALADAIRSAVRTDLLLRQFTKSEKSSALALLEINEAGSLTPELRKLPKYRFAAYPEVDIHAMPYPSASFDLVVHSDTLEHVRSPIKALEECRRVLKPGGFMCMTVPVVVGRLTRNREGLPRSYHGDPNAAVAEDYVVHSEFGADFWTFPVTAGFSQVTIHAVAYPCGLAISALNPA
jgi:SAM-dependent methyltransferase